MVGQTTAVVRVDLHALAKRINAAHAAFEEGMRRSLMHAVEAGENLILAKEHVERGRWPEWIEKNFSSSYRTARVYMAVAKRRAELDSNWQHAANLSLRGALRQLSGGDDDGNNDEPSPWTVQDVISNTKAGVVKWCERTPPDCRDLLAKCLRNLADEIEQRGGVS